ncbi:aldo/keto reductase [Limosilactobacillus difficilis]|uniref:aldo/keto reductase n=1 Tax=Limosilactobacillus difficilis TaxID=2991838 RepID=UPI0024B8E093|nr:aldo/keto reductase [Limosilactobacillus difficilis]
MEYTTLNNGQKLPLVGFGVYQIPPRQTAEAVTTALNDGYRLIDTAEYYRNEKEVGAAVRQSDIPRDEIFVTTKMPPQPSYAAAAQRIDESLRALDIDYIDLMLIHWPGRANVENYRALEDAQKAGKVRSIGLSSFYGQEYQEILDQCEIVPVLDQNETHVFRQQQEFQKVLEAHGTKLESWSPLAEGQQGIFSNPVLVKIAAAHHKSVAQVVLRFLTQRGIIVIPKSVHPERIAENINLFDFELTSAEMAQIKTLDQKRSIFGW